MGCGGSKDVVNSKTPKSSATTDPSSTVVKENPAAKLSRPPSLAAVEESKTEVAIEAPQPIVTPDLPAESESVAVSDVVIEEAKDQNPEPAVDAGSTTAVAIDTTLSSGTHDEHREERCISMAISSTDTTNNNTAEGITLDIPPSTDHGDNIEWSLSLTPVSRPASSISMMIVTEGEDTPSPFGEALFEQQNAVIALLEDDSLSSPKAAHEDLRTPNGVHSLEHADTGESCFGFQQLDLMELNQVSSAVELTYDEQNSNSQQQSPQSRNSPQRTLSGFHNPRVTSASMSRQSSVAAPTAPTPPPTQPNITLG